MKKIKELKCKGCQVPITPETEFGIAFDINGPFIITCPECNTILYAGGSKNEG